MISLILLWLPNLFFFLAMRVIRFKSHTRCDEFVLMWSKCYSFFCLALLLPYSTVSYLLKKITPDTGYRLANIFFVFFNISIYQAAQCFRDSPDAFIQTLASGIIRQSSFLMNLIILATGQETMLQLLQWRSLIKQAVFRPLVNLNACSRRYKDWLNEAPSFEKSFIFGE